VIFFTILKLSIFNQLLTKQLKRLTFTAMKLKTVVVGIFEVNCYLYWDETSLDGVIIDPGADFESIKSEVEKAGFNPKALLLTHGHGDHIGAVRETLEFYKIPLYAGSGEEELLSNAESNLSGSFGVNITTPTPDFLVKDEETITIGNLQFKILATPGHSPGGICYLDEVQNILFCGDTLFFSSIGRTDFPGCSHQQLLDSIHTKLLPLPDTIICYPGHGPATTIGGEKTNNPFLKGYGFV
jgi:glyoxylase-like metal-dependent hydrolase (beta-lactamase superfamily II)